MTETALPQHRPDCVEMTVMAIMENNAATLLTQPNEAVELTPETETEALEWLSNGNVRCHYYPEMCEGAR